MSEQAQDAVQGNTATTVQGDGQAQASLLTGLDEAKPESTEASKPDAASEGEAKADDSSGETKGDKPEGDTEDKPAEGAPEKYELKAPEGFEGLDPVLVEAFEPLAREFNLSNDKANKLVETMMPKVVERISEHQQAAWAKQLETWVSDAKADKEIGGEAHSDVLAVANRALSKFATPELIAALGMPSKDNPKGMGLGNHPELVRVFYRIGKAAADDDIVTSSTSSTGDGKSAAEILYGKF